MKTLLILFLICSLQAEAKDLLSNFKKKNLKILVEGHTFTEGPTCIENGDILFTSPKQNSVVRWSIKDKKASIFYQADFSISALYFQKSKLYATQGSMKRVIQIESPSKLTPLATSFSKKPFNKPNDLWVCPQGISYFTDPNYGKAPLTQDGEFAYSVSPQGKVSRIKAIFTRPNGIIGSANGESLYITDPIANKTYKFSLDKNGLPGAQTLFCSIGGDGMTLDRYNNLYIAVPRQKALVVINPQGNEIARIENFHCTNVTFGKNKQILYITAKPGLWAIKLFN